MNRRVILVLVAILFITSIPFVSADAHPIDFEIEPKTTVTSSYFTLVVDDVFGVSINIIGHVDIQIEYGRGQDVATWRNVTGYFMGNMTIERDEAYYVDFYNLDTNANAIVTGYIVINDYIVINTTSTTFPFPTNTTTDNNWLPDLSWLVPPLMLAGAVCIIIMIGCLCKGREENLHFLVNLEESLFGLPTEEAEE